MTVKANETKYERLVLGVDPGLLRTGWAVISECGNSCSAVASGVIEPSPNQPDSLRLFRLWDQIGTILEAHAVHTAGVECTVVNVNALSSLRLGQARGVILAALGARGIEVGEYSPTTVKKTLGCGKASKAEVGAMVKMFFPQVALNSSDVSDAFAVAMTHSRHCAWQAATSGTTTEGA